MSDNKDKGSDHTVPPSNLFSSDSNNSTTDQFNLNRTASFAAFRFGQPSAPNSRPAFTFRPATLFQPPRPKRVFQPALKKFVPLQSIETQLKNGRETSTIVNKMCVTFMSEHSGESLEELRLSYYDKHPELCKPLDLSQDFNDLISVTDEPTIIAEPAEDGTNNENDESTVTSTVTRPVNVNIHSSSANFNFHSSSANTQVVFNFGNSQPAPATAAAPPTTAVTFNMPPPTAMSFDQTRMMFTLHFT